VRGAQRPCVRVSTGEQALGPEAQRSALVAWCEAHRCTLVEVFSDQGVGGAAPADQRPGLSAALAGVKQHDAGILLVATRDRLARDTLVAALVARRFRLNDQRFPILGCEHRMHIDLSERLRHGLMLQVTRPDVSTAAATLQPRRGDTYQPGVKPLAVSVAEPSHSR
jgi:DNA invertase Pin-like site-specific DNA recombinase